MSSFKGNTFGRAKSLPTFNDLTKVARSRRIGWGDIKRKRKEELSNLLNIPLIYNPNYEREPPQRPSKNNLRLLASIEEDVCGACALLGNGICIRTSVTDTNTDEVFKFHARKHAHDALGTGNRKLIEAWGLSVTEHRPQKHPLTRSEFSRLRDGFARRL